MRNDEIKLRLSISRECDFHSNTKQHMVLSPWSPGQLKRRDDDSDLL